jgi:hypothetical protein
MVLRLERRDRSICPKEILIARDSSRPRRRCLAEASSKSWEVATVATVFERRQVILGLWALILTKRQFEPSGGVIRCSTPGWKP